MALWRRVVCLQKGVCDQTRRSRVQEAGPASIDSYDGHGMVVKEDTQWSRTSDGSSAMVMVEVVEVSLTCIYCMEVNRKVRTGPKKLS
jgi:hypothetical protein